MFAAFVPLAEYKGTKLESLYTGDLTTYLNSVFFVAISVGAAIAVMRIAYAGFMYMGSDLWQNKIKVKEWLTDAFVGLFLLLSAYVVLFTINPNILKFEFLFPKAGTGVPAGTAPAQSGRTGTAPPGLRYKDCVDCVALGSLAIPHKPPGPAGGSGGCLNVAERCQVNSDMGSRLQQFKSALGSGVIWTVSESWPPTRNHANSCHQDGTCVDLSISGDQRSVTTINKVYDAADRSGLSAQYEVADQARAAQLRNQGAKLVVVVPGISGEHFSMYKKMR